MPRIEQQANGTYVKKANNLEEQIIARLYKEINDREADVNALTLRITSLEDQMAVALTEIQNLKVRVQDLELKSL